MTVGVHDLLDLAIMTDHNLLKITKDIDIFSVVIR